MIALLIRNDESNLNDEAMDTLLIVLGVIVNLRLIIVVAIVKETSKGDFTFKFVEKEVKDFNEPLRKPDPLASQIFMVEGGDVECKKLLTFFGADRGSYPLFHFSLSQSGINQGITWKLVTWFS